MIELGLQRISRLLAQTPLPWRAIHIAGTNGKGSICNYVSGMLEAYNRSSYREQKALPLLKHGRFTSPHLIDRWDCITIDQETVSSELFHAVEKRVLARDAEEGIQASEFELLTATAFEIFTQEKVDVGVVEVGMGGRLDATNVLGSPVEEVVLEGRPQPTRALPLVTAVAQIGLDHEAFLGNTIAAITSEKAGIAKPGVPVVWHDNPTMDDWTLRVVAVKSNADIISGTAGPASDGAFPLDLCAPPRRLTPSISADDIASASTPWTETFTEAPHHISNISIAGRCTWLALQQLDLLPTTNPSPPEQTALLNLTTAFSLIPSQTHFPGRLQHLSLTSLTDRTSPILLDGAHNTDSAIVLNAAIRRLHPAYPSSHTTPPLRTKVTFLLAASSTKDISSILSVLLEPGDDVLAVGFGAVDGMPWVKAMSAAKILEESGKVLDEAERAVGSRSGARRACGRDVKAALVAASEVAGEGPLVVAGSLYLVGEVLRVLREMGGA